MNIATKLIITMCLLPMGLSGCSAIGAALGMGAAGSLLGGAGLLSTPTISLKQEYLDVEAALAMAHQHEMTVSAIEQSPVASMIPTPVLITPVTPPVVTPVPPAPIPAPKPVPVVP